MEQMVTKMEQGKKIVTVPYIHSICDLGSATAKYNCLMSLELTPVDGFVSCQN